MNDKTRRDGKNDEDFLIEPVSDEALEISAGAASVANYTLGACTGISVCPA